MNEAEIKALIENTVAVYTNQVAEINQCKTECEAKIAELNQTIEKITSEKNEIEASSQQIQTALDKVQEEFKELDKKYHELWEERDALDKALGEAKAKERLGELNSAIASFTDDEKAYAKDEIEAFNANPVESEINSVVDKILIGIGKKAKEAKEAVSAEQNAANDADIDDIFSGVAEPTTVEDDNIF